MKPFLFFVSCLVACSVHGQPTDTMRLLESIEGKSAKRVLTEGIDLKGGHIKKIEVVEINAMPEKPLVGSIWLREVKIDSFELDYLHNEDGLYIGYCSFGNFEISLMDFFYNENKISGNTFFSKADFSTNYFGSKLVVQYNEFLGECSFNGCSFNSGVIFRDQRFIKKLDFSNVSLYDSADIYLGVVFPDTVDFSGTKSTRNTIDLLQAEFMDSARFDFKSNTVKPIFINLLNADIQKFRLDYIHYRLYFPDSVEFFSYTRGSSKRVVLEDEKIATYEALLKNFRDNGQMESYEVLDKEYQEYKWKHSWGKWIWWFPKYWWNYGYNKEYIFIWTFVLIFLFTFPTYFFIHFLNSKVYNMENIPKDAKWQKKISVKDFWNRLWFSFVYTATVFFSLTLKIDKIRFAKRVGTLYLVLMYSIGLICLGYIANFIIQK